MMSDLDDYTGFWAVQELRSQLDKAEKSLRAAEKEIARLRSQNAALTARLAGGSK